VLDFSLGTEGKAFCGAGAQLGEGGLDDKDMVNKDIDL